MLNRILIILSTALLFSTCAATPSVAGDKLNLAQVEAGEAGAIVMNIEGRTCRKTKVEFRNVETDKISKMTIRQPKSKRRHIVHPGDPAIIVVPAGPYKLASAVCENRGEADHTFHWLDRWYEPFDVQNGEVRYIGRLLQTQAWTKTASNRIVRAMTQRTKYRSALPVYYLRDDIKRAKSAVAAHAPELAERVKYAPPDSRITPNQFGDFVSQAFMPAPDGELPDAKKAMKEIMDYMDTFKD